jgi:hypothetical protein
MADSDSGYVSASADDKAHTTDDLSIPTFLDRTAEAPSTDDNARRVCWRDHLPVHPAADLFPLMSESELRELGEDIKANGLFSIIKIDPQVVASVSQAFRHFGCISRGVLANAKFFKATVE